MRIDTDSWHVWSEKFRFSDWTEYNSNWKGNETPFCTKMTVSFRILQGAILLIWRVTRIRAGTNAIYFTPQPLQFYREYIEVQTVELTSPLPPPSKKKFYIPRDIYRKNLNSDEHVQSRPLPPDSIRRNSLLVDVSLRPAGWLPNLTE
jgi:hypothetical protein